jgi:RNA polymerase sigma-70 factor (ECF subfamily)
MIKICYRYAANDHDAGSIYNNAMLKVMTNLHRYSEQGQLFSWIKAIVIKCCIDYCKKKNIFKNVNTEPAESDYSIDPEVFDRVSYQEILKTIALLPGATATVFRLYVFEGFNHRQIGEQLGISEGTSKWHVSEAKKLLKKKFEPVTTQKIIDHAT